MITNAVFLGSKKFGFEIFKSLLEANSDVTWTVLCPPDFDDSRSNFKDFETYAQFKNLELIVAPSPDSVLQHAKTHKPDIMIVCGYYRILSAELFKQVNHGVFGFHNSLLPKYRGGSPLVWQMINNEPVLGSSLFRFSHGVDDGPLLDQVKIVNNADLFIGDAMDLIEREWLSKLPTLWQKICDGQMQLIEQEHDQATYCAQRQEGDGCIDWTESANDVNRFIRAQAHPYPRAFFELNGSRIKIVAHETDARKVYGRPGQVFEVRDEYITVCCGDNTVIRIIRVEKGNQCVLAPSVVTSFKQRF